ncbi:hypothetical protein MPOCJGCO_3159 [Methylobacterium trifolii]|uniref:Uncharacterized protein n=1 Tax=Methylobacterium trifolii TaxID=1003092 RepID=A0ABQ4U240_9HYPH|nr:hypothetical protein MPOCJGCO_3159 [Methylobacterium trifolii]
MSQPADADLRDFLARAAAGLSPEPPGPADPTSNPQGDHRLDPDGAAVIDPRVQGQLRAAFAKVRPNLYWLFLRTQGSPSIRDRPVGEDTPQAAPERHLDLFFRSLGVPYRAFEAEGAEAVAGAIRQIEALERDPIPYTEQRPRRDLTAYAYAAAALGLALLVLAKLAEADFSRSLPASVAGASPADALPVKEAA